MKEIALTNIASFDLETNENDEIYSIGAVLGDTTFSKNGRFNTEQALNELDEFVANCSFVLGHNLLRHDLPLLKQQFPDLQLHTKPIIDTLFLSPLAFPENPYHRLVKNYKLVRDSINDPVADSKQAKLLFTEQCEVFKQGDKNLLSFYAFCFSEQETYKGLHQFFTYLSLDSNNITLKQAEDLFSSLLDNKVCRTSLPRIAKELLPYPEKRIALAYCVAWLQVAGGSSILPPWVHHEFHEVASVLRQLRDVPCESADCQWCQTNHNPEKQLENYFGFPSFRAEPATAEGKSLQKEIVSDAMRGRSSLGILPTGGGKSLCFQLPALARFQRRGLLTIIISPLQALMKDQVDNLRTKTDTTAVAALYGMLTPPERGDVLEGIRMGNIGILYISPEQLRNRSLSNALAYREIGCWVFDEAHCLSKWGHDFRPDYLYVGRFIKGFAQKQKSEIPPIQCLTATAKNDVKQEIVDYFQSTLGQELTLFEGGVERDNLSFEVHSVTQENKYSALQQVLKQRLEYTDGVCIIYCAARKSTEDTAELLQQQGWNAEAFHAGLDSGIKRSIQDRFIGGELKIICATNAFGMGIDKEDVRLVIHLDIPGSLENYLQEAGRAGRDRNSAECIIFYDDNDIEKQFRLGANSQINRGDIAQLLRGLRVASSKKDDGEIIITSGELLRSQFVDASIHSDDREAQTKVFTAIAWLERAGLLERNENRTNVFQGSPAVSSIEEAKQKIDKLDLSERQKKRWLAILEVIISADSDEGFTADQLAEMAPFAKAKDDPEKETESQRVIRSLHDMKTAGLLSESMLLTAFVRHKVPNASHLMIKKIIDIENKLLDKLQEESPDADFSSSSLSTTTLSTPDENQWQNLSISRLNQYLLDEGLKDSNTETIRNILHGLSQDGKGMANSKGSLEIRHRGQDQYRIHIKRGWLALRTTAQLRQAVAVIVLRTIINKIHNDAPANPSLLIEFSLDDLSYALKQDTVLCSQLKDPLAVIDRALLYLHEQKIIILQNGLAIFRQAMTIKVFPDKRRYTAKDFKPLSHHYEERVFQVHVMNEYARIGLDKISAALEFVLAYFSEDKDSFIQHYFPRQKGMLERATSQQSYQKIVDDLGNPKQQTVVEASLNKNSLILAGPGSGKTRTVVHRCAWLLRVKRIPAEGILVLTFNRNAATLLRRRLYALVDRDAYGVTILTYHSLALRLTGHSFQRSNKQDSNVKNNAKSYAEPDFDAAIREAIALLKGETQILGIEPDNIRDRLLAGYRHILVDEYQDIDELQYELISAIAGRTQEDKDSKLTLLAVGDDDQNIYQFRGANIGFIRQFQQDYESETYYLAENYRSTKHIIEAANQLISDNQDRMKSDYPIRINKNRDNLPAGGDWEKRDLLSKGRVQLLETGDVAEQAAAILAEMHRLKGLSPEWDWNKVAVLSREWSILSPLRILCEQQNIPLYRSFPKPPPLFRLREIRSFLEHLKENKDNWLSNQQLEALLQSLQGDNETNLWWDLLHRIQADWQKEAGNMEQPVSRIIDYYYESLMEYKQNRQLGSGLLLSTVHSAKGMEYEHVFITDSGWNKYQNKAEEEESRRLYYVAMTRAQKTLALFSNRNQPNLLVSKLIGDFLIKRSIKVPQEMVNKANQEKYSLLALEDIYLGYAGGFAKNHPIHSKLAQLQAGDQLHMQADTNGLFLTAIASNGGNPIRVAKLSQQAIKIWKQQLQNISSIEIIAMVQWACEDSEKEYQSRCKIDAWEVPLIEIRLFN